MNNPDEAFASYDRYREAVTRASQSNKIVIFDALAAANITHVHIEFDGCGDSGQIDCVTAYRGEEKIELPTGFITLQQASWNHSEVGIAEEPLSQALETLCYDFLEAKHGGWEIDDGAYGQFRFDVAARTIELEFNGRCSDTYTENRTF